MLQFSLYIANIITIF